MRNHFCTPSLSFLLNRLSRFKAAMASENSMKIIIILIPHTQWEWDGCHHFIDLWAFEARDDEKISATSAFPISFQFWNDENYFPLPLPARSSFVKINEELRGWWRKRKFSFFRSFSLQQKRKILVSLPTDRKMKKVCHVEDFSKHELKIFPAACMWGILLC